MSQTAYNLNMGQSFAGMKADSRFDLVESFLADQIIYFGRAAAAEAGNVTTVHIPTKDVCVLLFDADFVTANTVTITVNGNATAAVPFNTDHDTTVDDVKAAIEGLTGVSSVTLTDVTNNREFTIETAGLEITVSEAVAGGASQATGTPTYSSDDIFRGIAIHTHKAPVAQTSGAGDAKYAINDAVNVLRQGAVWVETDVAVTADETAYVSVAAGLGKFTNVSSANLATGGKFRSTVATAGLAILEINLP